MFDNVHPSLCQRTIKARHPPARGPALRNTKPELDSQTVKVHSEVAPQQLLFLSCSITFSSAGVPGLRAAEERTGSIQVPAGEGSQDHRHDLHARRAQAPRPGGAGLQGALACTLSEEGAVVVFNFPF